MASLNRFTNAGAFRAIRRDLLIAWFRPWASYLERRGLTLPAPESERSVDYDKLVGVFIEPTPDMPAELVDSVFLIHGMANSAGMDVLLDRAAARGVSLEVGAKDISGCLERARSTATVSTGRGMPYHATPARTGWKL